MSEKLIVRSASLFFALYIFWALLSGFFTLYFLAAGAGSALAVLYLARRMDVIDHEGVPIQIAWPTFLSYWPWLIKEIIISAISVTRIVLSPRLPISPTLIEFTPSQKTDLGLVLHANSITLTPGTISIDVEPGRFLVHALTRDGAGGLVGSEMDRRCAELERV